MKQREFKDRLCGELGRIARALDSPRRLELIDLLAQGERSVEDLAGEAVPPWTVLRHGLRGRGRDVG